MIPEFNERGYLPAGIHVVTLDEVGSRFGDGSELRRVQMQSLRWLVELARAAGVQRFVVNGSFVTDTAEPNDVDCVLPIGPDYIRDSAVDNDIRKGLPSWRFSWFNRRISISSSRPFILRIDFSSPKGWWRFFYEPAWNT